MVAEEIKSASSLMKAFQSHGDETAFERIFSRFVGPAMGVARRLLSDPARAEDAVQEAFMRVIRKRSQYDASYDFAPWFYTILRNICTDMLRSRMRSIERTGHHCTLHYTEPDPSQQPDYPMQELMARLSDGQRVVLELRILHKMRFREIGAALGISEEAAKKRSQRGLRRLRELFFSHSGSGHQGTRRAEKTGSRTDLPDFFK